MCLCRDVIYCLCLVRSLCSERHKSGLRYTIKGPLMQQACEHDGSGEDEQSFESKQHSVSPNAPCPHYLKVRQTGKIGCQTIEAKPFFLSFTQL